MTHPILSLFGWIPAIGSALLLSACKNNKSEDNTSINYPYQVTTTVGMITDITRNVIADSSLAEVEGLIGEGIDPHLYKPTRNDLVALTEADVIFYNGLKLEGKMEDALLSFSKQGKPTHAVTDGIKDDTKYLLAGDDAHLDPHVWMDVSGWMKATQEVSQALIAYDPKNRSNYKENTEEYLEELSALDRYAQECMESIPENQRVLVTAHDAFSYLGRAYGIQVKGIQGLSTESEAGLRDIEDLVDFLVTQQIPSVFVESSVSDKNVRTLLEGAQARGHQVTIGGTLYSDAMGAAGTYEGTYVGMIDHNVTTIANALGGKAEGFKEWMANGEQP